MMKCSCKPGSQHAWIRCLTGVSLNAKLIGVNSEKNCFMNGFWCPLKVRRLLQQHNKMSKKPTNWKKETKWIQEMKAVPVGDPMWKEVQLEMRMALKHQAMIQPVSEMAIAHKTWTSINGKHK